MIIPQDRPFGMKVSFSINGDDDLVVDYGKGFAEEHAHALSVTKRLVQGDPGVSFEMHQKWPEVKEI